MIYEPEPTRHRRLVFLATGLLVSAGAVVYLVAAAWFLDAVYR